MRSILPILTLAFLTALALIAVTSTAQTPPPATGDWVIPDNTEYRDVAITVNGNITLSGIMGRLTLINVSLTINSSVPASIDVRTGTNGLYIDGCLITATNARYSIDVWKTAGCFLNDTELYGLVSVVIYEYGSVVSDCTLSEPSSDGIFFQPSGAKILPTSIIRNKIIRPGGNGIKVFATESSSDTLRLSMSYNEITEPYADGIYAYVSNYGSGGGTLNLTGTIVDRAGGNGIAVDTNKVEVDISLISVTRASAYGVYIFCYASMPPDRVMMGIVSTQNYMGLDILMNFGQRWDRLQLVGCNISDNYEEGIHLAGVYCATVRDSTVYNLKVENDFIVEDATIDVYNTTCRQLAADPTTAGSYVYSWRYVSLGCTWQNGVAAGGKRIDVRDDSDQLATSAVTDGLGKVQRTAVWDWCVVNIGGVPSPRSRSSLLPVLVSGTNEVAARDGAIDLAGDIDATVVFVDDVVPWMPIEGISRVHTNVTTFSLGIPCTDELSGVALVQATFDPEPDWGLKDWTDAIYEAGYYRFNSGIMPEGTYSLYWRAFDVANYPDGSFFAALEGVYSFDYTPPRVNITSPVVGKTGAYVTNKLSVQVEGTVEDDVMIGKLFLDDVEVPFADGKFSLVIPVFEGENVLTFKVQDLAGNYGNTTVLRIVLDTVEPMLKVLGPMDEERTRLTELEVFGETDPTGATVRVAGASATVDGRNWTATVTLVRGRNELLVEAFDEAGNRNWVTIAVVLDDLAPSVSIESPARGALLNTSVVLLTCIVEEDDTLASVTINSLDHPFLPLPGMGVAIEGEPLGPFADGEVAIVVEATDVSGNVGRLVIVVTIDTPPPSVWGLSVANGTATGDRDLELAGRTELGARLTLGGRDVPVESGAFSAVHGLSEGWNSIVLVVVDLAGNSNSTVLRVLLDTVPPELILDFITGPEMRVKEASYEVRGRTEPLAVLVVEVGGTAYNVTVNVDGTFSRMLSINPGRTLVNVTATDRVGNRNMTAVTLVRALPAPATPWTRSPIAIGGAAALCIVVAIGAAVSIETTKYSLLLLILPLYARIKKSEVLDNKTRYALHGLIIENPGTHYNAVIREFDLTNGEAAYHLSVLEREGFIRSVRDGTLRRFYSTTSKVPRSQRLTPEELREHILDLVDGFPGISQKQIVDELGIGRTLAGYHLKNLSIEGFVEARHDGRFTLYYPTRKRREGVPRTQVNGDQRDNTGLG